MGVGVGRRGNGGNGNGTSASAGGNGSGGWPGDEVGTNAGVGMVAGTNDADDVSVVYRNYATLYFVFVVDGAESELGILDLIQVCL